MTRNRIFYTILSSLVLFTLASVAVAQNTDPVMGQNTVLSIDGVNLGISGLAYSATSDGVDISAEYTNETGRTVVALSIGFILIDPFNDVISIGFGESRDALSPDATRSQTWVFDDVPGASRASFVVAYPYAVRLDNRNVRKARGNAVSNILSEQLDIEIDTPNDAFVR